MAKILTRQEALEEMRKERIEVEEEVDAIIKQQEVKQNDRKSRTE